jgi:hypothetical protein
MKYQQSAAVMALFLGTSKASAPQSVSLFATGMNGDEDLAEDITMKGDKFHYIQKTPTETKKVGKKAEPAAAGSCNPGETASVDGNCYFEGENVQTYADPPEKVLNMDPKIARGATSFYGQTASLVQVADEKHETEKLHVLEPIPSHVASFLDFPNQRTAFYAQLEDDKPKAYAGHFQSTDEKYVRKYDTKGFGANGGAEKVSVPDPRIGHTHTTFYDKKNGLWRQDQAALIQEEDTPIADSHESSQGAHAYEQGMESSEGIADARAFIRSDQPSQRNKGSHTVADPISPSDMDPWVYEYSKDNTNSQTQWHDLKHKPSEYATAQKSKKDIAEPGMEEEVHGFASDNVDVLPATRRDNEQYAYNGSGPSAFPPSFLKRGKRDIAEPGMEPNVHWFASDNVDVLPATRRDNEQYDYNGTGPKAFPPQAFLKRGKRDIAEPGMEPNVHWFASDNVDVLPATRRDNEQYDYNGTGPKAFPPQAFLKRGKRDIAEPGMEPNVHWFASDNVDVLPATRRDNEQYDYNGTGPKAFPPQSMSHKGKKDIAEPGMEEEVHGFASDNVDVLPATRRDNEQYAYNGSGPSAFPPQAFLHRGKGKKDIAEPKMDEEVHGFASDNVDVLPATRRDNEQYAYNGSGPSAFPASLYARGHKIGKRDIAEPGMEPNVHWFASDQVDVLPATRRDNEQYDYNGTGPKAFPPTYAQQSSTTEDIANHEVRPDVWVEVHKMINPASNWRVQEAPKSTYIPSPAATGPP